MIIKNSTHEDVNEINRLYNIARNYQKSKGAVIWPEFDDALLKMEISDLNQWQIMIDGQVAIIWSTTFDDPQIWGERNNDPSVYLHRIATNPVYRGLNLVGEIVQWAKGFARKNEKKFIRMDTVGENTGLINYYQKCGFKFLGLSSLKDTKGLPAHYHNAVVSLFQITLHQ